MRKLITIKIPVELLARVRAVAERVGLPYQTWIQAVLRERVAVEEEKSTPR